MWSILKWWRKRKFNMACMLADDLVRAKTLELIALHSNAGAIYRGKTKLWPLPKETEK